MPGESLENPSGDPAGDASGDATEDIEHFAPTGGRITGVLGVLLAVAVLVTGVVQPGEVIAPVMVGAALGGLISWAALLRPRVSASAETLHLRNMLETIEIPLAAVDELVVRQVLAVRVGEKKFVCPGLGRRLRKMVKGAAASPTPLFLPDVPASMPDALGPSGRTSKRTTSVDYVDHVESRLHDLVREARTRHGVTRYSDEALALAATVRRRPAWPEIGGLAVGGLVFVLTLVV